MAIGWFNKLKDGLKKSSSGLTENIKSVLVERKLDDDTCDALEEVLIQADMGVDASLQLIEKLRKERFGKEVSDEEVRGYLADEITATLTPCEKPFELPSKKPTVILMVGVNGSGKTTTIGKLTAKFKGEGKKVMLAAGDTFRAGAVEQLSIWAERNDVEIIKPHKEGADPAGVLFNAYEKAAAEGADILLADTAGRLQNRKELMEELAKITRVLKKHDATAPHETLLVLDATVGQNAHSQVETFLQTADISGLVINKLDSTAKGGVVVALAGKYKLPLYFIGIGEGIQDLRPFNAAAYARALMGLKELN